MRKSTQRTKEIGSRTTDSSVLKAKIRERYKDVILDKAKDVPAVEQSEFYHDDARKRVAVYTRVHSDDRQSPSYELHESFYTNYIAQHPYLHLVDIYTDAGTSNHRDQFNRMIDDCKAGKIDLIITKSISRFSRNIVECISYIKMLRDLEPPIGVLFVSEALYTLEPEADKMLSCVEAAEQEIVLEHARDHEYSMDKHLSMGRKHKNEH